MPKNQTECAALYILRHGETEWNTKDILQGRLDSPLTQRGLDQARQVARELRTVHFDAVFSSDLLRARRTSEIITLERHLAVTTSELLRERDWGHYDGKQADLFRRESRQLLEQYDRLSREEQWSFKYYPDIESHEEVFGRFMAFLREVAVAYPGKQLLVVTHYDVLRTLLIHLQKRPVRVDNLAYIVLLTDGVDMVIEKTKGITLVDYSQAA